MYLLYKLSKTNIYC